MIFKIISETIKFHYNFIEIFSKSRNNFIREMAINEGFNYSQNCRSFVIPPYSFNVIERNQMFTSFRDYLLQLLTVGVVWFSVDLIPGFVRQMFDTRRAKLIGKATLVKPSETQAKLYWDLNVFENGEGFTVNTLHPFVITMQ